MLTALASDALHASGAADAAARITAKYLVAADAQGWARTASRAPPIAIT
jgi:LDH2 family malate/lactate/ureidoglycolate dehydrogenase